MTTDAAAPRTRVTVTDIARRMPATIALVIVLLVLGLVSGALWAPFRNSAGWQIWSYGLPALEQGRWWTPVTGTFFLSSPWMYPIALAALAGMAYLEYRRGTRTTLAYVAGGQLVAVLGAAFLLWALTFTGWPWALAEAQVLDVGPAGAAIACIAAAIGLLPEPWRLRAWLVLLSYVSVTILFWATLSYLGQLLAVLLVLGVDRSVRIQRASAREQRLIAFVALLTLAVIQIVVLIVPTRGPFGENSPEAASLIDVAFDLTTSLLIANGLRRGRRWAWVWALVLAGLNILGIPFIVLAVGAVGWDEVEAALGGTPSLSIATILLWLFLLVYLVRVRRAFQARRRSKVGTHPRPTVADVKGTLRAHGGGTLSWMTTWDGNSYARTATGIVAYQRRAGVAIALADPLGAAEGRAASVREFISGAEHAGLVPCFFSASAETLAAVPEGWRSLVVADDTIVDLPGLTFTGKAWNSVRTSFNRADRDDVSFRLTRLNDEPWGVRQQLRAISEGWVGEKGLPEMGFTLGTLAEAADPEVRLAIAIAPNGDVDGFLSWLPVFGEGGAVRGWTLDLMRRREGGFGPVMEFLIGSSARAFSDEGAEIMSLSGAPLTHDYPEGAGLIADLSTRLAEALEPVYGFRSLHRFKQKFNPRYETMYLLYRDESDLTRIGLGLTRAFLPTATLGQLAGAGLELVGRRASAPST